MPQVVTPEELRTEIGHEFGPSAWIEIGQDRIDVFADVTDDHQFIHVDPDRAAQTPFGGTIAHGFLTMSLLTKLTEGLLPQVEGVAMSINYGFDRVRFITPVRSGARVRARVALAEVSERGPGRLQLHNDISVEIEGEDTPALTARWISLLVLA